MADIAVVQITEGTIDGNGVFDKLMQAGEVHLTREFKSNRITGKEYSTVYLGMLQAAMGQSIQFLLGEQVADKQADLLIEQTLAVIADVAVKNAQSTQDLLNKQEQITSSTASTVRENAQSTQDLLNKSEQVTASVANTVREDAQSVKKVLLLQEQVDKTTSEEALLIQKKITEVTQTVDATGGTMKKQQELITKQTNGFDRDAEQKLAKIVADSYAVQRTTNNTLAAPTSLDGTNINTVIGIAQSNLGT